MKLTNPAAAADVPFRARSAGAVPDEQYLRAKRAETDQQLTAPTVPVALVRTIVS